jgi:hypothetical protein
MWSIRKWTREGKGKEAKIMGWPNCDRPVSTLPPSIIRNRANTFTKERQARLSIAPFDNGGSSQGPDENDRAG